VGVKGRRRRRTSLDLFDSHMNSQDNRLIITRYPVVLFDRFQCLDILLLKAQSGGLQALRRFDGTIIVSDVSPEKPLRLRMGSCHETVYRVGATLALRSIAEGACPESPGFLTKSF